MSGTVRVHHEQGYRFEIEVRQHSLEVDQPMSDGGDDLAPTPTELFVSSLAACVGFYAQSFLARHGLPATGLRVEASFDMARSPARVGRIRIRLHLPDGVPAERRAALLAVARHCTVHNTLEHPPVVLIEADLGESRAA